MRTGTVLSVIDTREELVDALTEAAELEHGILLQYLFAAYSMKKRADEGLGPQQQEDVRRWEGALTRVAREEMAHLGSVCNLLAAVGGPPRLGRPNFPQPRKRWYPFDFRLQRFGDEALYRFLCLELPEGEPPPAPPVSAAGEDRALAPDPLVYRYLGELYGHIRQGFASLPEKELFIGPRFTQDTDDWSNRMALHLVVDRPSAEAAIDAIVLEGEGSPGGRARSHYGTFLDIRAELARAPAGFEPARPVVTDPCTRQHRDAPEAGVMIADAHTRAVAQLFNHVYVTTLLLLLQYYSFSGETASQRVGIRQELRHLMSAVIRPVAEVLTELPVGGEGGVGGATAGPAFELYSDVRIATQVENRWTIVAERLRDASGEALALAERSPRLRLIGESLEWINLNMAAVAAGDR